VTVGARGSGKPTQKDANFQKNKNKKKKQKNFQTKPNFFFFEILKSLKSKKKKKIIF